MTSQKRVYNKIASRCERLKKRRKFEEDMEEYNILNAAVQLYPPTSFEVTEFASPNDPKPEGDRKEKNRISAKNSRERKKRRNEELERRLEALRKEADLRYLDMLSIVAHDMFIKKLDDLYLPEEFLDIPVDLSDFEL